MTLILIFVYITVVMHHRKGFLYPFHMVCIRSSDELVIGDTEIIPEILECRRDLIGISLCTFSSGLCRLFDLLTVFIGPCKKIGVKT